MLKKPILAFKSVNEKNSVFCKFWYPEYNKTIKKLMGLKEHFDNWANTWCIYRNSDDVWSYYKMYPCEFSEKGSGKGSMFYNNKKNF